MGWQPFPDYETWEPVKNRLLPRHSTVSGEWIWPWQPAWKNEYIQRNHPHLEFSKICTHWISQTDLAKRKLEMGELLLILDEPKNTYFMD
jgi:hypothetical protein